MMPLAHVRHLLSGRAGPSLSLQQEELHVPCIAPLPMSPKEFPLHIWGPRKSTWRKNPKSVLELHSTGNKFTEGTGGFISLGHNHTKGSHHLFGTYCVLDTWQHAFIRGRADV